MSAFRIAAITDEFSPDDLDAALDGMAAVGMTGAELRVVGGRNMIDLSNEEVDGVRAAVEARGMEVVSLASPLLKCVLPDSPPLDSRVQHDVFGSPHTFEDQPRLTRRAFEIAERLGARIIRVFSYWRTTEPEQCYPQLREALLALADEAAARGVVIGLENEHACNVGTGAEAARFLLDDRSPRVAAGLGSGQCVDPRRDAVSRRLRPAAGEPHRPRPREGLLRQGSQAGVGRGGRDGDRLARPDRRAAPRRLPRLDQPGDPLDRPERRQVRSQHDLRQEPEAAAAS